MLVGQQPSLMGGGKRQFRAGPGLKSAPVAPAEVPATHRQHDRFYVEQRIALQLMTRGRMA
jgi:hypothetical protein